MSTCLFLQDKVSDEENGLLTIDEQGRPVRRRRRRRGGEKRVKSQIGERGAKLAHS